MSNSYKYQSFVQSRQEKSRRAVHLCLLALSLCLATGALLRTHNSSCSVILSRLRKLNGVVDSVLQLQACLLAWIQLYHLFIKSKTLRVRNKWLSRLFLLRVRWYNLSIVPRQATFNTLKLFWFQIRFKHRWLIYELVDHYYFRGFWLLAAIRIVTTRLLLVGNSCISNMVLELLRVINFLLIWLIIHNRFPKTIPSYHMFGNWLHRLRWVKVNTWM